MTGNSAIKKDKLHKWDLLLILGWILAPMTGLRIWKIGPAEVLCLIWMLRFPLAFDKKNILLRFWVTFLLSSTLGGIFCIIFYPNESAGFSGLITWYYLAFVSYGVFNGLKSRTAKDLEKIVLLVCILGAIWYLGIYIYSISISKSLFGIKLWYSSTRFSGGGTNPHQIAGFTLSCIFLSFYCFTINKNKWIVKACLLSSIIIYVFLLLQTKSSTAIMAMMGASFFAILVIISNKKGVSKQQKRKRLFIIILITVIVALLFINILWTKFYNWVASDSNGLGRLELFSYIWDAFAKNPVIGLGPGNHSANGKMEFHNTYLEIIAMSGIIGTYSFIKFSIHAFKRLSVNYYLWLAPIAVYIQGLAGFSIRRLPFWLMIGLLLIYAEKYQVNTTE